MQIKNIVFLLVSMGLLLNSCENRTDLEGSKTGNNSTKQEVNNLKISPYSEINKKIALQPNDANLYYLRAQLKLSNKEIKEALDDIDRGFALDSSLVDLYLVKADILFKSNQTLKARKLIEKSIELDNENIEAHLKLAEMYFYAEQYKDAIKHINDALKLDVYNDRAYFLKGMTFKYAGDTGSAVSSFQTAIEQNPDNYKAQLQLGMLYATKNDPKAEAYFNNAIMIDPSSVEAIYAKSMYLQNNGKTEKAIEGYELIMKIDPQNDNAPYNIGYIKMAFENDFGEAVFRFQQAIGINPMRPATYYNLGFCFEQMKNIAKAKLNYKAALKLNPKFTLAKKGLARVG